MDAEEAFGVGKAETGDDTDMGEVTGVGVTEIEEEEDGFCAQLATVKPTKPRSKPRREIARIS